MSCGCLSSLSHPLCVVGWSAVCDCGTCISWSYSFFFWKRCFLKTSVSNGIIYTKYTQNPHIIEPPFNIATQSATYTVTACVSRWEPNVLNANNPCPAARQKQYWYFISLLRFSALKCKPKGQKNVVVLENLIIESLHMIKTEL